jgi:hypothetical protein
MNARKLTGLLALALAAFAPSLCFAQATCPPAIAADIAFRNHPDYAAKINNTAETGFVDRLDDLSWGSVPSAILDLTTNPTDADTLTIGADVYEFCVVATNDDLANNTNIGVVVGADAATTAVNLIAAINATDQDCLHATLDNLDGSAAHACGTENIFARAVTQASCTQCIQIRPAQAEGDTGVNAFGVSSNPSIVLAEGLTAAGNIWEIGVGINLNTLGGRAPQPFGGAMQCKTITAAMITNSIRWSFPFAVTNFMVQARDTNGGERQTDLGDVWTIDEGDVILVAAGGAAPDVQATDVVCVLAFP